MRNYSFQLDDDDELYLESLRSTFSRDERRRVSTRDLVIAALQAFESTLSDIIEVADIDDDEKSLPRKPRRKRDADGELIDDDDEQDDWDGTPSPPDPFQAALDGNPEQEKFPPYVPDPFTVALQEDSPPRKRKTRKGL